MTDTDSTANAEILAVSPLTGCVYAVSDWDDHGDGKIVAERKRELTRDEIEPDQLHGPARQAYNLIGGGR